MNSPPVVLTRQTPAELLVTLIAYHRHPTTLIVCATKADFLSSLGSPAASAGDIWSGAPISLTLLQKAVSRHIGVAFVPSATHLRAYLAVFRVTAVAPPASTRLERNARPPLLLVYGLLELHRGGSEWSAQGIGTSLAALVDAARGTGLRAAIVEPVDEGEFLKEKVPLLSNSAVRSDGTFAGRTVEVRTVLERWFEVQQEQGEEGKSTCD